MTSPNINPVLLQELQRRAEKQQISLDALLQQLLYPSLPVDEHLLNAAPLAIILTDMRQDDAPAVFVNDAFCQMAGYPREEIIGRNCRFLQEGDSDQPGLENIRHAIETGSETTVILRNYRKNGTLFWNELHLAPLRNAEGEVTHFLGIQNDVTERVNVQQALQEKEHSLSLALLASQAGVWVWDIPTNALTWDAAMEAMHGLAPGTFSGDYEDWRVRVHPDDLPMAEAAIREALVDQTHLNTEFRVLWPDDSVRYLHAQAMIVRDKTTHQPLTMIGVNRDITQSKIAEQDLRKREEQLRWLVQHMPVLIDAFNAEGHIIVWNQECERVSGYTAEEILDNPQAVELLYPDPAYRQEVIDDATAWGDKLFQREYRLTCKDGSQRIVSWSHIPAPYAITGETTWAVGIDVTDQRQAEQALRDSEQRYRLLTDMMSDYAASVAISDDGQLHIEWIEGAFVQITGREVPIGHTPTGKHTHPDDSERVASDIARTVNGEATYSEYRHLNPEDKTIWLGVHRQPEWDASGQRVARFYVVAHDITARKHAEAFALENERLKQQFQREQAQNTLIQRIVAMLSHDLRTPLSIISTSREIITHYGERLSPEQLLQRMDIIGRQVSLMDDILRDTVNMVHGNLDQQHFRPTLINLAALCQVSVNEIAIAGYSGQQLHFENISGVTKAWVDEILISRILLNLLSNAIKYTPEDGHIRLELNQQARTVVLCVKDNGLGIAPDDLPHIFEPFYRSQHVQAIRGTGLGLSIVKDSVTRHQGHLEVESILGQGTTFSVYLPDAIPDA